MPPRQNSVGRWEQQKRSPPNATGKTRRLYVVCPPERNSAAFCRQLMAQKIERHVSGVTASRITFGDFARDRFLKEYPASRNLRPSSTGVMVYLLERVILPEIGRVPLSSVDTACVARLSAKLRDAKKAPPAVKARTRKPLAPNTAATAIKVLRRMLRASKGLPRKTEITDAGRAYLEKMRGELKPGSFAIYAQMIELHLLPRLARTRLGDLDEGAIERLGEELLVSPPPERAPAPKPAPAPAGAVRRYSDQTLRLTVITIKSVLAWAEVTETITRVPKIELPKVSEARKPKPYTKDEARALIGAARDDEERALFLATFDMGLRKSEILGLEWSQVVFERQTVLVDRQRYRGRESETKSGREREVPMTIIVEVALRKIRRPGVRYVFADEDGRPREEHWLRGVFERAQRKAALRKVRWHDHRHTFSTMRTDQKVPPFVLQKLLGHADIRTTQKYVHASADRLDSVMDGAAENVS